MLALESAARLAPSRHGDVALKWYVAFAAISSSPPARNACSTAAMDKP